MKKFKIVLCASLVVAMLFSQLAFAEDMAIMPVPGRDGGTINPSDVKVDEEALKAAILEVKEKYNIGDEYDEFNYSVNTESAITLWNFQWTNKKTYETLNISYGSDKITYSYYHHYNKQYGDKKQIHKVKKSEAQKTADEFLKTALLDKAAAFIPESKDERLDKGYYYEANRHTFLYNYIVNNIPVFDFNARISVDTETGNVDYFYCPTISFDNYPSDSDKISLDAAKEAYMKNMGYKLVYMAKTNYEDKSFKVENVYPAYVPVYTGGYGIDAFTGERIAYYDYSDKSPYAAGEGKGMDAAGTANLSPAEQKEVDKIEGVLPLETALKVISESGIVANFTDYKLNFSSLGISYGRTESGYVYSLNFFNDKKINSNIELDAKTGEIVSFNELTYYQDAKAEYDADKAKNAAEAFLKKYKNDKFEKTTLIKPDNFTLVAKGGKYASFTYVREENNTEFSENYLNVTVDTETYKVVMYSQNWYYNITFPAIDNVKPLSEIYTKLFESCEPKLQYMFIKNGENNASLVYDLSNPPAFDAVKGEILNPATENPNMAIGSYSDINDSYAKDIINDLAEIGIGFAGEKFEPQKEITQYELLSLISQTFRYSLRPIYKYESNEEINEMYRQLESMGIIKKEEFNPTSLMRREEAVKFIVRAMGNGKIAEHSEIFVCDFNDFSSISTEYKGFVAIAKALGIVTGSEGSFKPLDNITRAEAAVMVYRYLSNN